MARVHIALAGWMRQHVHHPRATMDAMGDLLTIEAARAAVLAAVRPLAAERVDLAAALGRVLAEDVTAAGDVPPFDNSAMDGYLVAAGPAGRQLAVVGESRAGAPAQAPPGRDEAIRISTGALVPPGGEAVVPVEQAAERDGRVTLTADVAPGQHIRRAGEDVARGTTVLRRGTVLDAAALGVAATVGRATVRCARRPRVAIVVTGDELAPPGQALRPGQIHETNGLTLGALAAQAGADVALRERVRDAPEATRTALARALGSADVVLASGGVSVGAHDHVKDALGALGVERRFWGVALRPGKPTWFGTRDDALVFGLPGNPVSAMVTFLLFVRPALAALQGADPAPPRVRAHLSEAVRRLPGRDEAVRVRLAGSASGRVATPTGPQGSHQLTSMLGADGLALVPAGEGVLPAGTEVDVELIAGVRP
jgi:molybdopterin molybdotransferase